VMERSRVGRGAHIRRAIIDQDNDIPRGERIGFDLEADRQRFHVTDSGIVVVPARFFPPRRGQASGVDAATTVVERLTGERQEAMA
jgi:glucose-1-phosphate adenylyltransferase